MNEQITLAPGEHRKNKNSPCKISPSRVLRNALEGDFFCRLFPRRWLSEIQSQHLLILRISER